MNLTEVNTDALRRAIVAIGGDELYNTVERAYQAIDQAEKAGYDAAMADVARVGDCKSFAEGYHARMAEEVIERAEETTDLLTAAEAFAPKVRMVEVAGIFGDDEHSYITRAVEAFDETQVRDSGDEQPTPQEEDWYANDYIEDCPCPDCSQYRIRNDITRNAA